MADRKEAERRRLALGCGSNVGIPVALVVVVQVLVDIRRSKFAVTPFLEGVEFRWKLQDKLFQSFVRRKC
jgi:hypothetical protein